MGTNFKKAFFTGVMFIIGTISVFAQDSTSVSTPHISMGNTAWMLMATALVLLMTIPGLAFFYGGLVRSKNVLNILMQCFVLVAVISIEWVVLGYSMSFGSSSGALAPYIGGFDWFFLNNIGVNDASPYYISMANERIPHIVFVLYQCMFAVITPALIIGAFAERVKFKGILIFSILWAIFVYNPVAHWMWSADGWLYKMGALDFAGGIVVHITAGIAALVMAIMTGSRKHYENQPTIPHNTPFVALGTGLLWFGWFGFNAGSGLAADGVAANAFLVTHIAAAVAAFTWAIIDWLLNGKPSVIGVCTGAVAGLAAITPTAGFVDLKAAFIIAIISSMVCYYMVGKIKIRFKYDDSLDAFGVHGIAGIIGSLLVGLFATGKVQEGIKGGFYGDWHRFSVQVIAVLVVTVFTLVGTYLIYKLVNKFTPIRATHDEETVGLDLSQHNEIAYHSEE
jgi:Amt family ammonium transporter